MKLKMLLISELWIEAGGELVSPRTNKDEGNYVKKVNKTEVARVTHKLQLVCFVCLTLVTQFEAFMFVDT